MKQADAWWSGGTAGSLWLVFSEVAPVALGILAGSLCTIYWAFKVALIYREWRKKS